MAKQQKTNAMRILEQKKLPHTVNYYECSEFTDAVQIAQMLGQDPEQTFKTLMCTGKSGEHYAFVMQGTAEMDLKKAAAAAGEKSIQLLPVKEIQAVTGYIRGGCTAIGMKKDYPVYLDETALLYDEIIVSGGRLGTQIMLTPDAFLAATGGKTADLQAASVSV
ncbi:MAG: Cys-tRNA(Pro) deacylase [Oscillospiraceae bacterium]|nr:Cys-tRNA(Pro) deacylase [Oscillospiraceae bacterium]